MGKLSKMTLTDIYLEWVNNWVTVSAMAGYYGVSTEQMNELINISRHVFRNK